MSEPTDETIQNFCKTIDLFSKGFEAITKNIEGQLEKMLVLTEKLEQNTAFMPKIMKSNKEIKKSGEQVQLMVDALMARLDSITHEKGY